jgi:hypothetical protein
MSSGLLLLIVLLVLVPLATVNLSRGRRRPKPPSATPVGGGLVFQRPIVPPSRVIEMQHSGADKPPMFANAPAALDGESAPDRLSSS